MEFYALYFHSKLIHVFVDVFSTRKAWSLLYEKEVPQNQDKDFDVYINEFETWMAGKKSEGFNLKLIKVEVIQ